MDLAFYTLMPQRNMFPMVLKIFSTEDEQGHPVRVTPVARLTNAFTAEWNQIPAARFQNLAERLSQMLEACFRACCSATECIIWGMTHPVIIVGCNVQLFKIPNSMRMDNMYWCHANSFCWCIYTFPSVKGFFLDWNESVFSIYNYFCRTQRDVSITPSIVLYTISIFIVSCKKLVVANYIIVVFLFLELKSHIVISVMWYPKGLTIILFWEKKKWPAPPSVPVWQDWNVAVNELFSISRGEVYAIRYALLCEACLCDTDSFLSYGHAYMRGSSRTFIAQIV